MPAFLIWDDEDDAQTDAEASLAAVDIVYGCPYVDGDYKFDKWCDVSNSDTNEDEWGFYKPEARLGKLLVDLLDALLGDFTEVSEMPTDWVVI